jgi:hypothetical protein
VLTLLQLNVNVREIQSKVEANMVKACRRLAGLHLID